MRCSKDNIRTEVWKVHENKKQNIQEQKVTEGSWERLGELKEMQETEESTENKETQPEVAQPKKSEKVGEDV